MSCVIFCEVVAIYGVIVAIILQTKLESVPASNIYAPESLRVGYAIFASGIIMGFANLVCGSSVQMIFLYVGSCRRRWTTTINEQLEGVFSISSYTQYFNVDIDVVLNRLISSLHPIGGDFFSKIDANPHLASSCTVYGVVPPPHQLLVGVQSSGNELNVKTSSNPCLTSSDGSSTPTPLVSSFDFVNSDLPFCCFSCDAYLDAQAIL
ncbi:V-type proton ATPase subunit c''2 [Vitis vinifera]|uniref:V-type proton ATPase subunit c''2 n=1 Tax=Vitis vinifera TaxID=29760 RepID=A0A438EPJ1_VITVI|nr:V-type proton ATPase subunit c''2 [Vitis vinifera]